jgi:hypothetical protein
MISVIDMPPAEESIWWRGKKELEVGFFPAECVDLIRSNFSNSSNDNFNRSNNQSGNQRKFFVKTKFHSKSNA